MPATSSSEKPRAARAIARYAALGDSFTAGARGDDDAGRWPDDLAARLRRHAPELEYWNLAEPGARSEAVAREQLGPAISRAPDLVTLVCGANDVLLSVRPDIEGYAATFSAMLGRLARALPAATVLTATTPDLTSFLRLHERSRERVAAGMARLNDATRWVSRRHGVTCLEFEAHPESADRGNYAADGYHPSRAGNVRAAAAFCAAVDAELGASDTKEVT
jgi:lysophospholipase L1-like esterase